MVETRLQTPAAKQPTESVLAITVLLTSVRATLAALRRAGYLARELDATIRILSVRVVPYPLPLDRPQVDASILARRLITLAGGQPIPAVVQICFGRDVLDSLLQSLRPNSIVLVGAKRAWWPWNERRLARQLSRRGHHVILITGGA